VLPMIMKGLQSINLVENSSGMCGVMLLLLGFGRLGDFDIVSSTSYVRKVPIVLKTSFSGDERNFLGPLMRFAHGDVRDHIVSPKNDHRPS